MQNNNILLDTHVHMYDCFDMDNLLDSADKNFRAIAKEKFSINNYIGVLCLTESSWINCFSRIISGDESILPRKWGITQTKEMTSILFTKDGQKIYLISGKQVVTFENIEVLVIGSTTSYKDGEKIDSLLCRLLPSEVMIILPWGVGKWVGKRGKKIRGILKRLEISNLLLGDNSGRPWFFRTPDIFGLASEKGIKVLPGSDPLPFPQEHRKVGICGCYLKAPLNQDYPFMSIKSNILNSKIKLRTYNKREKIFSFLYNQFAMQIKKYKRKLQ